MKNTAVKGISLIIVLTMILMIFPTIAFALEGESTVIPSNFFKITTVEDFSKADSLIGLSITDAIGDGALTLDSSGGQYASNGEYISQVFEVPTFKNLIVSWNSDAPAGTYIEVSARAATDDGPMSEWFSWGEWGLHHERGSVSGDVDEFVISQTANRIQVKATLHTDDPSVTPTIRLLAPTMKNGTTYTAVPEFSVPEQPFNKIIEGIEPYSQMIRDIAPGLNVPKWTANGYTTDLSQITVTGETVPYDTWSIGSSICSLTTITGLLNHKGEDVLPEELALSGQDFAYGFGNWPFSAAAAGAFGYESYIRYGDINLIKSEINAGYPVGISIRYSTDPNNSRYVEGAPLSTSGHIILIRGFETIEGVEYVWVNDSAFSGSNEVCYTKYRVDQFLGSNVWPNGVIYVVHDKEAGAGTSPVQRVSAQLQPTGEVSETYGTEYKLVVSGQEKVLPPYYHSGYYYNGTSKYTIKNNSLGEGGVIGYTVDGLPGSATGLRTTASKPFTYTIASENGGLYINESFLQGAPENQPLNLAVYVMGNDGITYVASKGYNQAPPAPTTPPTEPSYTSPPIIPYVPATPTARPSATPKPTAAPAPTAAPQQAGSGAPASALSAGTTVAVTSSKLTLRNANGDAIGTLSSGDRLVKIGQDGSWTLVKLENGTVGRVASTYLGDAGASAGSITSNSLVVRSGGSSTAAATGKLSQADHFDILGISGGWAKIRLSDGSTGYVAEKYVKAQAAVAAAASIKSKVLTLRSTSGAAIGTLTPSDSFKVLYFQNAWAVIQINGQTCKVAKAYIQA